MFYQQLSIFLLTELMGFSNGLRWRIFRLDIGKNIPFIESNRFIWVHHILAENHFFEIGDDHPGHFEGLGDGER